MAIGFLLIPVAVMLSQWKPIKWVNTCLLIADCFSASARIEVLTATETIATSDTTLLLNYISLCSDPTSTRMHLDLLTLWFELYCQEKLTPSDIFWLHHIPKYTYQLEIISY